MELTVRNKSGPATARFLLLESKLQLVCDTLNLSLSLVKLARRTLAAILIAWHSQT
jgi:hypothetical protein